ncbi:class I SAM-dependent methyltransferase [Pseudoxanthomonas dokdonensis]|uniref:class I SAM-dependent methyltransferase n=1 Tax=Pseudoxanthomonas dokdonensis TaxID=344882 RepID=UPI0009FA4D9D|nr:methyltransferase domain-containing protein [Pseudoxanthomonas dokdonensis]
MTNRSRLPHAVLDEKSRRLKARKIIELIGPERFKSAKEVLEIGCGSGAISSTLKLLGSPDMCVHAVDVVDNRIVHDGYDFNLVTGTTLPFDSAKFDIIISNHVIEHVGDENEQLNHLLEIRRVLKPSGCAYLAVPNKWRIIEPHYRLAFLSWLPLFMADYYLRLTKRGTHYDCLPLSAPTLKNLLDSANFNYQDMLVEAVRTTLNLEYSKSDFATFLARRLPSFFIRLLSPLISTIIFKMEVKDR